jgi:hypothetical protein
MTTDTSCEQQQSEDGPPDFLSKSRGQIRVEFHTIRHISATPPPPIKDVLHPPENPVQPSFLIEARKSLRNHPATISISVRYQFGPQQLFSTK